MTMTREQAIRNYVEHLIGGRPYTAFTTHELV